MRDLFDPKSYVDFAIPQEECWGCGCPSWGCKATATAKNRFRDMTGLEWGYLVMISVPLRKDLDTLGLDNATVPEGVRLCADCAVRYMEEFNSRLHSSSPYYIKDTDEYAAEFATLRAMVRPLLPALNIADPIVIGWGGDNERGRVVGRDIRQGIVPAKVMMDEGDNGFGTAILSLNDAAVLLQKHGDKGGAYLAQKLKEQCDPLCEFRSVVFSPGALLYVRFNRDGSTIRGATVYTFADPFLGPPSNEA